MFERILDINALDNFILLVKFETGETKKYDLKPLFDKFEVFQDLKNIKGLYKQVKIDRSGYGIYWNDDIDLSSSTIYEKGQLQDILNE